MRVSDFALYRVTWSQFTPWPYKWAGIVLNAVSVIAGLVVAFGAASFGVAAGLWLFDRWVS